MATDVLALVEKHRGRGVLIDTNLLVLFFIGLINPKRLESHKRTSGYSGKELNLLLSLITKLGKIITTPHILSQVSDLAVLDGNQLIQVRELFKESVKFLVIESHTAAAVLVDDQAFRTFGLADIGIAKLCAEGVLVLTADFPLYTLLKKRGLDVVNFNHLLF